VTDSHDAGADPADEPTPLSAAEEQEVRDLLGSVDGEPMPEEVWQRLSASFAAESATRGAAPTVLPQLPQQRRATNRWVPVAAGVAVLAVGGVFGLQLLGDGDDGPATADSAGRGAAVVPVVATGTSYTTAGFEAELEAALPPAVTQYVQPTAVADPSASAEPAATEVASEGPPSPQIRTTPAPEWLAAMDLPGCLEAVDETADPTVVDAATYDEQRALVIAYRSAGDRWEIFAVTSECNPDDVHLLRYVTVSLP
jgi:hypothetical protein